MRLLIVSNFYPPYFVGGYELGCRDVAEGLKARGHDVRVLTSDYGVVGGENEANIQRTLTITYPTLQAQGRSERMKAMLRIERHNQREFRESCAEFKPDVVYFWNMAYLSISLAFVAQSMGLRTDFFVSEHWLATWQDELWYSSIYPAGGQSKALLRALLLRGLARTRKIYVPGRRADLDLSHTQFCSLFLKNAALKAGKQAQTAQVIHWGVDTARFARGERPARAARLLFVGRVIPEKGVHIVIEAVRLLASRQCAPVSLTIAGGSSDAAYLRQQQEAVTASGLAERVRFTGPLPREQLALLYQTHDILVFPSIWEEPFGITPLEAMATGMPVVGTLTGGSPEIFKSEVNALVYQPEDAEQCAAQIARLVNDPVLLKCISDGAYKTVQEDFTLRGMIDTIEKSLEKSLPEQTSRQN